jgi:carboxyl-terminal processing protease
MLFLFSKKFIFVGIFLGVFLLGAVSGIYWWKLQQPIPIEGVINQQSGQPEGVDFSLFWDVWKVVQQKHPKELPYQEMVYGAIKGMLKSLDDPYTIFLEPQEAKRFQEDYVEGQFEGVGLEIGIRKQQLQVISPLENTPAQRAGLRAGDKILKIGDKETFDMTLEEAVNLIRGPKGTEVKLTVLRADWEEPKEFTITRDVIQIPTLSWEMKDGDIAYIRLYQFSQRARSDFAIAAQEIQKSGARGIILDLRNNPGGFLEVAQDIAGWFLERGQLVTIEKFAGGKETRYLARGPASLVKYPVVVIINQGSASASEILAGALRDNRGVLLVGEKSFGKGSVQELENLRGGSALKITVANWLTPKGNLITDVGLEPDHKVEMKDEDFQAGRDTQLDKAIEILRGMR